MKKPGRRKARKDDASARLSPREQAFVAEYLVDFNATAAAQRAGYAARSAGNLGHRLMKKAAVKAAIDAGQARALARVGADATTLLNRLVEESNADVADLFGDDGRLKPVKEWPAIWRRGLVAGLEINQLFDGQGDQRQQVGDVVKIKLADRAKRLEMLGRHKLVMAFRDTIHLGPTEPLKALLRQISGQAIAPRVPPVGGGGGKDV